MPTSDSRYSTPYYLEEVITASPIGSIPPWNTLVAFDTVLDPTVGFSAVAVAAMERGAIRESQEAIDRDIIRDIEANAAMRSDVLLPFTSRAVNYLIQSQEDQKVFDALDQIQAELHQHLPPRSRFDRILEEIY